MMTVLMCVGLLMGCFSTAAAETASESPYAEKVENLMENSIVGMDVSGAAAETVPESLYVKKVENLPEDFIFGMDVSSVLAEEKSGVKYYDFDGKETDLFRLLAENGINTIRVRIWNDPYDEAGHDFGGGNCDIANAVEIGKRAASCGLKLIADFH